MAKQRDAATGLSTAGVLAGGRPMVRLNLRLRLTSDTPETDRVPEQVTKQVLAQEEKLLKFLRASRENQVTFLTDPVAALEKADIKLGPGDLAALRRLQPGRRAAQSLPAGVDLSSLSVEVLRKARR